DFLILEHGLLPEHTRDFFQGRFQDCILGKADLYEELEPFLPGWGMPYSVREFVDLWFEMDSEVIDSTFRLIQEIAPRAESLSIGTNQEVHRSVYLWETLGFKKFFQRAFISSEMGSKKPGRLFFEKVVEALGAAPGEIVLIDDSRENVATAEDMGWRTVLYEDEASLSKIPQS
ncbi:MAG: HAD-IA family hydrolase, partial [Chloroflexi bacterium]|nr:HAD-IA family hydrolase [Chloroflexota bacterium]